MIDKNELLFTVDENNNPIEPLPRKKVHAEGIWHRTSHIWVINSSKQILCQKRSILKDNNAGKWAPIFGGHLAPHESYEQAAQKELLEETGIYVETAELELYKIHKDEKGKEFQGIFYLRWDGDILTLQLEKDEVDKVQWISVSQLQTLLIEKKDPQWSSRSYDLEFLLFLTENW